jgi:hypothetical protein
MALLLTKKIQRDNIIGNQSETFRFCVHEEVKREEVVVDTMCCVLCDR